MMKRGYGILLTILIMMSFSTALAAEKQLKAGETWEIVRTTTLDKLTIAGGASIQAPEGHTVTMTVNGIGTPAEAGSYKGNIVLTVAEEIEFASAAGGGAPGGGMPGGEMPEGGMPPGGGMPGGGMPGGEMPSGGMPGGGMPGGEMPGGGMPGGEMPGGGMPGGEMPGGGMPGGEMPGGGMPGGHGGASAPFKAAVYVENGKYVADKSVAAMVTEGKVSNTAARDIKLQSNEGNFNGIIVTGDEKSTYTITNPVINLNGNGGDDASGLGMGIAAAGKAEVTVENARIVNSGANRSAVFVKGEGIIHVNNSYIETNNGVAAKTASDGDFESSVMSVGPWLLGITGKVRATNVIESGTAYYNNTHIKSQAWGALSTDGPVKVRLYATDCTVETVESGYGVYSIGDCVVHFSGCTFNVADYGAIICDFASATFTDATTVNSRRIGIMMHDGSGGSKIAIDKGSVFNTKSTVFQIKGRRGANIFVDNAQLNSEAGMILQTMPNDDPNMSSWNHSGGDQSYDRNVNATFSNTTLKGDIVNGFTASGAVSVSFKNASITGAITTAIVDHKLGPNGEELSKQTPELYYLIGEVTNTYRTMPGPNGVSVTLDADSAWTVDKTSYLTSLTIAKNDSVKAPAGLKVSMTVDGIATPVKAGAYSGKIVLKVTKM